LPLLGVASLQGNHVFLGAATVVARGPLEGTAMHVANPKITLTAHVVSARSEVRVLARPAVQLIVALPVLIDAVVGSLAGSLPLELRTEALLLLLAERGGLS